MTTEQRHAAVRTVLHNELRHNGIEPCSDGGCIFIHPGGQHTNGGCRHLKDIPDHATRVMVQRMAAAMRSLANARRFATLAAAETYLAQFRADQVRVLDGGTRIDLRERAGRRLVAQVGGLRDQARNTEIRYL